MYTLCAVHLCTSKTVFAHGNMEYDTLFPSLLYTLDVSSHVLINLINRQNDMHRRVASSPGPSHVTLRTWDGPGDEATEEFMKLFPGISRLFWLTSYN
jgi:hypothetical protein